MLLNLSNTVIGTLKGSEAVLSELANLKLSHKDVTELIVSNCELVNLDGLEEFTNVKTLIASHNKITNINRILNLEHLKIVKLDHNDIKTLTFTHQKKSPCHTVFPKVPGDHFGRGNQSSTISGRAHEVNESYCLNDVTYEYFDLSDNSLGDLEFQAPFTALVLMLSNNRLMGVRGMDNVSVLEVLDLSNNIECDATELVECKFSKGCKIFLENTHVLNGCLLKELLECEDLVIHADVDFESNSVIAPLQLDFSKLKGKNFISTKPEYADFVYEGDVSPTELLSPRWINMKPDNAVYVNRSVAKIGHLETQSTVDDISSLKTVPNAMDYYGFEELNIKGVEGLSSVLDEDNPDLYTTRYDSILEGGDGEQLGDRNVIAPGLDSLTTGKESEFLSSSIKLCEKLDVWNEDLKSSLYNE